mgnify:CR=1 FL=1
MEEYSQKVMDHFMNPRNVGSIENPDGVGEVGNPRCGDIMRIYLKIDNDVITVEEVNRKIKITESQFKRLFINKKKQLIN